MSSIPEQTRLPARVALEVVLQGIRIRFGRSMITVSGVVLGVAFLMSILAGIVLKQGVSAEDALRIEVSRMRNFLRAEVGVLQNKQFALLPLGTLSRTEERFLTDLAKERGVSIRVFDPEGFLRPVEAGALEQVDLEELTVGVHALVLSGDGVFPGLDPAELMSKAEEKVMASTHPAIRLPETPGLITPALSRELNEMERQARLDQRQRDRSRDIWIILISLLVTIMGISNAMLMSVTERFREIGTMKCLGALSSFVRRMFLFESAIMGIVGGIVGAVTGLIFTLCAYLLTYGPGLVLGAAAQGAGTLFLYALLTVTAGVVLSVLAALYPANVAAGMMPALALRSNV